MKVLRWLPALLSLAAVVVFTWWDVARVQAGPGALHPAHAQADGLDHGANCSGCHQDGAVAAAACITCHRPIGEQLAAATGLHGSLPADTARACGACHSEHHGAERPLLPAFAFASAGIEEVDAYQHEHVAFGLEGVHLRLACEACHPGARSVTPPAGSRYLGLSQRCISCHQDVHDGAFGDGCAACHGQDHGWHPAGRLAHERFPLDGRHAEIRCVACHDAAGDRAVSLELEERLRVRTCSSCHPDPHGRTAMAVTDSADCARCHDTTSFETARSDAADHSRFGFELIGPHAEVACSECHDASGKPPKWGTGAAPSPGDCGRCHVSPHQQALLQAAAAGPPSANGCADCHLASDATFAMGRISPQQHSATGFLLEAPHDEVACSRCHGGVARQERFPGRSSNDCRVCHGDPHGRQFRDGNANRSCTECHERHAWTPHRFGVEEHAVTFPLTGAHDGVACVLCHQQGVHGWRRFVGTSRACSSCHEDVHEGRFDEEGRPSEIDGRRGCARCHETSSFRALREPFDHARWTGYRLEGAHGRLACAACHETKASGALGDVAGATCSDCHQDIHRGQFEVGVGAASGTDCRRCHLPEAWRTIRFDHARDSRFQLDATHGRLACARCHVPQNLQDGSTFVRYRPLGRECADCHRLGGGEDRR